MIAVKAGSVVCCTWLLYSPSYNLSSPCVVFCWLSQEMSWEEGVLILSTVYHTLLMEADGRMFEQRFF